MSDKLVVIKLTNGETVMGNILKEAETETVVHNPITLKYLWDDVPPTLYATPTCALTFEESHIAIVRGQIVALYRPSKTLVQYYTESVGRILSEDDEDEIELEDLEVNPLMGANTGGMVH